MGTLKVVGKARKEFTCDIMYIKLSFKAWGDDTAQAIETSMSQCDLFLDLLEKQGIDINLIHMSNADVSQDMYDDKLEISSERKIELRMPFDMNAINRLSEIIKENRLKVDMEISFKLTNMLEVHEQLLKEAVFDSKTVVMYDALQSEEGGRFYKIQNRNMIVEIPDNMPVELPYNYTWMTLAQMKEFMRYGMFNIEARSLISAISFID